MANVLEFSQTRCIPYCTISRKLGIDVQVGLRLTGARRCPGVWRDPNLPEGEGYGCSLPNEALEGLAMQHPGIPASILRDAVTVIIEDRMSATDLPPPAPYSPEAIERWGEFLVKLDRVSYPDHHFDIAEILI